MTQNDDDASLASPVRDWTASSAAAQIVAGPARIAQFISEHALDAKVLRLPQAMPTVPAAAASMGVPISSIAKTLVFAAGEDFVVVVAPGDRRVDRKRLAACTGRAKLAMATAEQVLRCTGYEPGGVAPIGLALPVPVVVDAALSATPRVLAGGGEHELLLDIAVADIVRCNQAAVADVTQPIREK